VLGFGSSFRYKALVVTSALLIIGELFNLLNHLIGGRLSHDTSPKVPKDGH
jgi:hypothetical protein